MNRESREAALSADPDQLHEALNEDDVTDQRAGDAAREPDESCDTFRYVYDSIEADDRRRRLFELGSWMRSMGYAEPTLHDFVAYVNAHSCAPPLDDALLSRLCMPPELPPELDILREYAYWSNTIAWYRNGYALVRIERRPSVEEGQSVVRLIRGHDDELDRDVLNLDSHAERIALASRFARQIDFDARLIEKTLLKLSAMWDMPDPVKFDPDDLLGLMAEEVVDSAQRMAESPGLIDQIMADFPIMGIAGETSLAMTVYLLGTSRLLDKPLAAIVQGSSSAGKSYTVSTVARLFPDEVVLKAHDFTANSMYYLPSGHLEHRFVVAGERRRKPDEDATRAWRELIADGVLRKCVTRSLDGEGNEIVRKGPISYIETTTQTKIFDEDRNRMLLLHTDESPEQTQRIMDAIASSASGATRDIEFAGEEVLQRHRAFQLLLRSKKVIVPFAERLVSFMPDRPLQLRRAFPLLLSAITASAILHQFQRVEVEDDVIEATIDDYRLARMLISNAMADVLQTRPSESIQRLIPALREMRQFTTGDAVEAARAAKLAESKTTVYDWLKQLDDLGFVEMIAPAAGSRPATWRLLPSNATSEARSILPAPEELLDISVAA